MVNFLLITEDDIRGHLNGRIILIFSVNKRCSAGFLVENIEQYRREPLKEKLTRSMHEGWQV
jgi:hypothetical protein